ncbi:MAG: hypothetical protein RL662_1962 [Bacteroidota bacterium]|jgi:ubiquinone/menaquinone biosynthesis C-methylase UbiE
MQKYLDTYFDSPKLAKVMDELPVWSAPFGLKLVDAINYKKNLTVLDIGFYTGFPLTELAMRLGESSVVYGIDPFRQAIERAKEKIDAYGINNIKIIEGVAEFIPLADNSVDLVTSNNGINNTDDIEKVFSECSRVMKSGGQLVQTMNLSQSMFEFYAQLEFVLLEMNMKREADLMYAHIEEKRPSVEKIKTLMQRQGFIIKKIEYDQFNYRFADGTTMLNYYFIRLAFMNSWIALLPVDKVEEVFSRIESRLNDDAEKHNGVKLSIPYVLIDVVKK